MRFYCYILACGPGQYYNINGPDCFDCPPGRLELKIEVLQNSEVAIIGKIIYQWYQFQALDKSKFVFKFI